MSDISKVPSVGRAEIENMKVCIFSHFQIMLLKYDSMFFIYADTIACEAARYLIICLINYLLDHYNQFPGSRDPGTTVGSHCTEFPGDVRVVTSVWTIIQNSYVQIF